MFASDSPATSFPSESPGQGTSPHPLSPPHRGEVGSPTTPYVRINVRSLHSQAAADTAQSGQGFRIHTCRLCTCLPTTGVLVQVLDFRPSSSLTTPTNVRESQLHVRRSNGAIWGGTLPPPNIVRRVWRVALGYAFCVSMSLLLIHWLMSRLPSPRELASQLDMEPSSMVLRIPRYAVHILIAVGLQS